uniref:CRIB domain-containing protein n=1 Tax=Brassica campestris TaxID=3711 RepID=M4DAP5_BRACM
MEIGHPTEVKHVNHVGWEVSSGSAPAWVSSVLIYFFLSQTNYFICRHRIYSIVIFSFC